MTPVRVLGACGIVSAALSTIGGFGAIPALIGVGGFIMLFGNCYALLWGRKGSS